MLAGLEPLTSNCATLPSSQSCLADHSTIRFPNPENAAITLFSGHYGSSTMGWHGFDEPTALQ
jgi:hypothetical protein